MAGLVTLQLRTLVQGTLLFSLMVVGLPGCSESSVQDSESSPTESADTTSSEVVPSVDSSVETEDFQQASVIKRPSRIASGAEMEDTPWSADELDSLYGQQAGTITMVAFDLQGMSCGGCVNTIGQALQKHESIDRIRISLTNKKGWAVLKADGAIDESLLFGWMEDAVASSGSYVASSIHRIDTTQDDDG